MRGIPESVFSHGNRHKIIAPLEKSRYFDTERHYVCAVARLLVAQRLDRIEAGGFVGRIKAELFRAILEKIESPRMPVVASG